MTGSLAEGGSRVQGSGGRSPMQTRSRDGRAAALWAAFAILTLVFATEIFAERALFEQRDSVLRTHEVIRDIQDLRTSLADALAARHAYGLFMDAPASRALGAAVDGV